MADTPIPVVRLVPGVVQGTAEGLGVNVGGTFPPVWWPAGYIPTVGDAVKVLMVDGTAVVHSPVIVGQRPLTGTVAGTAVDGLVPVTTTAGTLQCRYTGTAPAVGVLVRLDWQSTTPWVWPSAASSPTPPPDGGGGGGGGPTPPPNITTGTLSVASNDSGSWSAQGWSSFHASNLTQGSYSGTYTGAWFYGAAPTQVKGSTITGFRVRLGARRRIGSYNANLGLNVYLTDDAIRPSGDTGRVAGPVTVTLPPNAGPQWLELPAAWGQAIADGQGGLGIAGGSYGGVTGVGVDPASGQIQLDWRRG